MQIYYVGNYAVPVIPKINLSTIAILEPAQKEDMPISGDWKFAWTEFWDKTDFQYQGIVKLNYDGALSGLMRFALYSNEDDTPYLLEILHLESVPQDKRLIDPIGRWLIWYAVKVAFSFCVIKEDEPLIQLDSTEKAIPYYSDIVGMRPIRWTTIAPGEDGYIFQFTLKTAKAFCERQTKSYGYPT
ncbi:hypothetical protein [Nodularia sp. UHCC 0506]|uniref:hypothetical protein n=1 Tax=Nodularia sp. UHCC 0506 TaxID=3110243 RepID=UPI002B1EAADC|nr:hypothetical protein [Nodularia sp. UHCC 0506]MEA5513630.1 hypothetical protein [Nodularia sp. UHCC 0506]